MNAKVKELVSNGMSERQAYRIAKRERKDAPEPDFDYEKETPKGEWV